MPKYFQIIGKQPGDYHPIPCVAIIFHVFTLCYINLMIINKTGAVQSAPVRKIS
ncbi:hypothetical protein DCCM_2550 [Desulfocucumis palustris]|uniref:Uncharacterized protein n=1 Tax=Desulfocucumis palustris TaxID=1898651 RepID=A0A2L2XAY5_9FIRM|nr:hypothetical protein DCCM_2550 [Desulfocucumis palustris]